MRTAGPGVLLLAALAAGALLWFDSRQEPGPAASVAPNARTDPLPAAPAMDLPRSVVPEAMPAPQLPAAPDGAATARVPEVRAGTLTGRVVDAANEPVAAARVGAFSLASGDARDGLLAFTNTDLAGRWQLQLPPDTPVWLVAVPMQPAAGSGGRDSGAIAAKWLPAATSVTVRRGEEAVVPDLQLPQAALVTGVVRWTDGAPIDGATVAGAPFGGATLTFPDRVFVKRRGDGSVSPGAVSRTGPDGRFTLPAVAGTEVSLHLLDAGNDATLVSGGRMQDVVPPGAVEFRVPRPVLVRCRRDGIPAAGARLEIRHPLREVPERRQTNARGELSLVTFHSVFVSASLERTRSPGRELGVTDAGRTVDLELVATRTPVEIEFDGEFRVRNTIVSWQRDDGWRDEEHLLRDDRGGAFTVYLEPGRYEITAGPGDGERNGAFLLPVTRTIEVAGDPVAMRLPATFGGSFTVMVTDSSGAWVGGACELRDANGEDVTAAFRLQDTRRRGLPGELLAGGINAFAGILAPGVHELMCDFGVHGAHRERVVIRPREITEVRIRLP
jgi:hypothetical protein